MLHSLTYSLEGVYGPSGTIYNDKADLVRHAGQVAKVGADILGDILSAVDSEQDDEGCVDSESINVLNLLNSDDETEQEEAISRISDLLKINQMGYIDLHTHDDLFALIEYHDVIEWISPQLRTRIKKIQNLYGALAADISDQWSAA